MQAVVLVGGEGTRLRPLTYDIPKPMLPIVERPIISRVVEWLALHGVRRAVLALGYRPGPFMEAFPEASWDGVELLYATEPEPLDTAGAVAYAADYAGMTDERLVILNGDVLTDLDLAKLVTHHEQCGAEATITLTPVEDPSPFGVVALDDDSRILEFVEKPPLGTAPSNLINAGTYVFEPEALRGIERGRRVSMEREVLPNLVRRKKAFAMDSDAYWIDTGTPPRYIKAQLDVISGLRPNVILPECTEKSPGVLLGTDAELAGEVSGSVFLGARAVVEAGAVVEDSVIGTAVRVRAGAEIRRSVILRDAVVERGGRLSDSVVGPSSVIGEGANILSSVIGGRANAAPGLSLTGGRLPD